MKKDDEKDAKATLPEDFSDSRYAGKEVNYHIKVSRG